MSLNACCQFLFLSELRPALNLEIIFSLFLHQSFRVVLAILRSFANRVTLTFSCLSLHAI